MKTLLVLGVNHGCMECYHEGRAFSRTYKAVGFGSIGHTRRNIGLCKGYQDGYITVDEFFSQLSNDGSSLQECLRMQRPFFEDLRKRRQIILPLRPFGQNGLGNHMEKYLGEGLRDNEKLMAIVGRLYRNLFRRGMYHPDIDMKFLDIHECHEEP